jgi:hypothetical protein
MIKPGVTSGFHSLKDALKRKANEQSTKSKGRKQQHRQQLFNTNSSSMYSLVATAPTTTQLVATAPSTTQSPSISNKLSLAEHKAHVLKCIQKWCSDNKENFDLEIFHLEENIDFILNIDFDENNDVKASIKCKCNRPISLSKNDHKIQVSNYYKHLQSNGCDHIKNIKKASRDLKSKQQQQQQQSSTPNTLTSSQSHSPLIQVPIVSPVTTQITTHNNSPASSNQAAHNGKRRLASQSQQNHLAKRSRK